jgi:hypothetical protein
VIRVLAVLEASFLSLECLGAEQQGRAHQVLLLPHAASMCPPCIVLLISISRGDVTMRWHCTVACAVADIVGFNRLWLNRMSMRTRTTARPQLDVLLGRPRTGWWLAQAEQRQENLAQLLVTALHGSIALMSPHQQKGVLLLPMLLRFSFVRLFVRHSFCACCAVLIE